LLDKPLILEYYGFVDSRTVSKHVIIQTYFDKTKRKNTYYHSNPDIYFIEIHPKDLTYKCLGLKQKLDDFILNN
jgi:hypothetical protein